jgi:hypothetical protein
MEKSLSRSFQACHSGYTIISAQGRFGRNQEFIMPQRAQARFSSNWRDRDTGILTWDDLDAVQAALSEMAPTWSAELNKTCADESTIVVMPEGANDMIGPSFVLHRTNGRVYLDQFHWDEYRKLGEFRDLDGAMAAMMARLVPMLSPRPTTWH